MWVPGEDSEFDFNYSQHHLLTMDILSGFCQCLLWKERPCLSQGHHYLRSPWVGDRLLGLVPMGEMGLSQNENQMTLHSGNSEFVILYTISVVKSKWFISFLKPQSHRDPLSCFLPSRLHFPSLLHFTHFILPKQSVILLGQLPSASILWGL